MRGGVAHFRPAELAWFAVARDPHAPRWATIYHHIDAGCEACGALVLHYRETSREAPLPAALAPSWVLPRRVLLPPAAEALHLWCVAMPFQVDLLLRSADHRLSGQVTLVGRKYEPAPGVPVGVVANHAGTATATTFADRFGEFVLAGPPSGIWGIRLGTLHGAPPLLISDGQPL